MKRTLLLVAFTVWVGLTASSVRADTINLVLPASYGDVDNYVGVYGDPEPSSLEHERGYISNLISVGIGASATIGSRLYDRLLSNLTPLPAVPSTGGVQGPDDTVTDFDKFIAPFTGTAYVLGKYDGPNGGGAVWLVSFESGDVIVLPSDGPYVGAGIQQYGLSHYAYFPTTSVPEPGILILLGIAMSAVGIVSRYVRKI